jgi:NAD(P)-dependent dehydrogenase (short-subunit alcohol dehydrogenase family)
LGEATARRLTAEGASVVIADIARDRAQELADQIGARAVWADVTDADACEAAVALAAEADAGLRVSVTCAGLGTPAKLLGREGPTPLERFAHVINFNLVGTINVLRLVADAMSSNVPDDRGERGVCVQTASIAAFDGQIGQVAYAASKGGVVGLTLPVDTPLLAGLPEAARTSLAGTVPFPSCLGDPAEYADLVEHVVTNSMLNGEVVRLDGGLRMAPR